MSEAITVAGPVLRGGLLSAFGELIETDPTEAKKRLLQLDLMDIDLAAALRAGGPGAADDPTTQVAPFFAAGLVVARQGEQELTAEAILRRMESPDGSGVDPSGLRELLTSGTHIHPFDESVVANLRLSYAGDHLRNGTRLGWTADTDNARAVTELARAHREAERLATEVDVDTAIRGMLGGGAVVGGLWTLAEGTSLIASTLAIGIGAAVLVSGAIRQSPEEGPSVREQHESAKVALTTALNALHEPLVVGPEVASAPGDRIATTVAPDRSPPRRQR